MSREFWGRGKRVWMVGSLAPVAGGAWRDAVLVENLRSQQLVPLFHSFLALERLTANFLLQFIPYLLISGSL